MDAIIVNHQIAAMIKILKEQKEGISYNKFFELCQKKNICAKETFEKNLNDMEKIGIVEIDYYKTVSKIINGKSVKQRWQNITLSEKYSDENSKYQVDTLGRLEKSSKDNALNLVESAKKVAEVGNYGHACALITLAFEEHAKSQIINFYADTLSPGKTNFIIISGKKFNETFRLHTPKRITMLTQLILDLTNTHDINLRQRVFDSIIENDCKHSTEVEKALEFFDWIVKNRNNFIYVSNDGMSPFDYKKEDYDKLLEFASKKIIPQQDGFITISNLGGKKPKYEEIEKSVEKMYEKYKRK